MFDDGMTELQGDLNGLGDAGANGFTAVTDSGADLLSSMRGNGDLSPDLDGMFMPSATMPPEIGDMHMPSEAISSDFNEAVANRASALSDLDGMCSPQGGGLNLTPEPDFPYTPNDEWKPLNMQDFHPNEWGEALAKHNSIPMGHDENGIPIFNHTGAATTNDYEGEYLAPVQHILPYGNWSVEWKLIPEAGEERDALRAELKSQWLDEYKIWENTQTTMRLMEHAEFLRKSSEHAQNMAEIEFKAKEREIQMEMEEINRASAACMSVEEYRTVQSMGLSRACPSGYGLSGPTNIYKDGQGNYYKVDSDGSARKLWPDGTTTPV